jgi:hypothetical protein
MTTRMPTKSPRRRAIIVNVTRDQQRIAKKIAESRGETLSTTIRDLLREEYDRQQGGGVVRGDAPSGTSRRS